jgi:integrase
VDPEVAGSKPVIHPNNSQTSRQHWRFSRTQPLLLQTSLAKCYRLEAVSAMFLPKNRRFLYDRVTVPYSLRAYFKGRIEVWKSLRTTDRTEAQYRAAQWQAKAHRLFRTLTRTGADMTKTEIDALIESWIESELDESEDARVMGGPISDDERENIHLALSNQFDGVYEALVSNDLESIAHEADDLLKATGLPPLNHDSLELKRLCRKLLQAKVDVLRIEADRWNGEYKRTVQPIHRDKTREKTKDSPLWSVVVEKYLSENPRRARSVKPLKAELMRFIQTIGGGGDRPIATITKADGRTYKDSLLHTRKLSLSTAIQHLSDVGLLCKWAAVQGYASEDFNPVKGLAPSKRAAKKLAMKRRPFTDDELLTVLGSSEFLKQRETRPERYWLVLLCLFAVCRREEAGQLNLSDIGEAEGVPFIRITDDGEGQTLKNEGSKRRVPIHSALIRLGFLKYVQRITASGHPRLFPQLKRKGPNGFSDPVGKWFGRMVTHCKLHAAGCPDKRSCQ